ncbi:MAG: hypothetical protein RI913_678, partial [Pseudomonadota bacterium]
SEFISEDLGQANSSAGFPGAGIDETSELPSIGIDGRSRLNPGLTFDSFVTGKANQLARAAAIQVWPTTLARPITQCTYTAGLALVKLT